MNSKLPDDRLQVGRYYPVILDPFRGEWLSKEINFLPGLDGFSGYALSPDMNSVIHDYDGISYLEKTDSTITQLWTDENAHLPSLSSVQWSQDSAWAVFASQDLTTKNAVHLLLVSRDNKVVKEIRNPRKGKFFKYFYWSANSRFFAFISPKGSDVYHLFVFDTSQNKFVIECPLTGRNLTLPEIVWSPDNSWIAISQEGKPLRVLKITDGKGFALNFTGKAVGWSTQFMINISP